MRNCYFNDRDFYFHVYILKLYNKSFKSGYYLKVGIPIRYIRALECQNIPMNTDVNGNRSLNIRITNVTKITLNGMPVDSFDIFKDIDDQKIKIRELSILPYKPSMVQHYGCQCYAKKLKLKA